MSAANLVHLFAPESRQPPEATGAAAFVELAVRRTELLLRLWMLHGLHSTRVRPGVEDLDLVSDTEALYLLTRRLPGDLAHDLLTEELTGITTRLDASGCAPTADDPLACALLEITTRIHASPLARDLLVVLLSVAAAPPLGRVMHFAAGKRQITVAFLTELLSSTPRYRAATTADSVEAACQLHRNGLIDLEPTRAPCPSLCPVHLSSALLLDALRPVSPVRTRATRGDGWRVEAAPAERAPLCLEPDSLKCIRRRLAAGHQPGLVVVHGGERSCDTHHVGAALAAERRGVRVCVDLARLQSMSVEAAAERLRQARREAVLRRGLVCLEHGEVLDTRSETLAQTGVGPSTWLAEVLAQWLVEGAGEEVWLLCGEVLHGDLTRLGVPVIEIELTPTHQQTRAAYWAALVAHGGVRVDATVDVDALLSTYQLSAAEQRAVLRRARRDAEVISSQSVHQAAAEVAPEPFNGMARRVALEFVGEDLKLPQASSRQFDELIAFARHGDADRTLLGERFKMSYGRAVAALFTGPPGTGKTMGAAVLARELGRALYQVNLAQLTSKWVGETEKNLERLFEQAEREAERIVLLLDEADSIASKRTSEVRGANDKHANNVTNFLLQRLESFAGTVVMTTNNTAAIDPALMRRLQFQIEFPAPDSETRQALWARLLPEPLCSDEASVVELAERWELTGGTLKNALRRAAVRAAAHRVPLDFPLLHRACIAELRQQGHLVRDLAEDRAR